MLLMKCAMVSEMNMNTINTVADALRMMEEHDRRGELLVRELMGWNRYPDASGRQIMAPNRYAALKVREPMAKTVLVDERVKRLWEENKNDR